VNADQIAGLPGGCFIRPPAGHGARPMILRSQAEADRAAERIGWLITNKAKEATTMSTTTITQIKLTLSCGHVKPVEAANQAELDLIRVGDKVHCAKCPATAGGEMRSRTVKSVGAPGRPLDSHEVDVARDVERSSSAQSDDGIGQYDDLAAEAVTGDGVPVDEAVKAAVAKGKRQQDAEVVEFPSKAERIAAAKRAGADAKAAGGNAGEASAKILSMPIKQAQVKDRSSTAKRPRTGRLDFLNLSPVRNQAIQAALGRGSKTGKDGEDIAKRDLLVAVTNEAPTVDLHAPSVRVLLRNLPRVAGDDKQDEKVRNAAKRLNDWLAKLAEAAGYAD
jgi:hypothetical protein